MNAANFVTSTAWALAGKNDILVVRLHLGGKEIASRIAKAHRINSARSDRPFSRAAALDCSAGYARSVNACTKRRLKG